MTADPSSAPRVSFDVRTSDGAILRASAVGASCWPGVVLVLYILPTLGTRPPLVELDSWVPVAAVLSATVVPAVRACEWAGSSLWSRVTAGVPVCSPRL